MVCFTGINHYESSKSIMGEEEKTSIARQGHVSKFQGVPQSLTVQLLGGFYDDLLHHLQSSPS
jgi:hypothetical protein